ncbi:hypothetical protein [Solirubrum puertoriconensis]|uniref:Uncharacterized protein n=1 Tax=Solirubrum puertoriconensis TaxID=1751427 RepID=A0A9X0HMD6_SOLP1|nr:hypothetical protein [Solirubrum puertoriconensis]KUG08603.1 hypothetical protein ASU33_10660 [Solirubrum puertoriconensis]
MNAYEKTFYYASMAMLYAAVVLHIVHIIGASQAVMMLTSGMALFGIANHRHMRRLKQRVQELEAEVRRLHATE